MEIYGLNWKRAQNPSVNWYRFVEPAGTQLADSSIPHSHCGTNAPGWLNESHPTTLGENVIRNVCFSYVDDNGAHSINHCRWNIDVEIRKCEGFYLYKFPEVPGCNMKYCGQSMPLTCF